MSEQQNYSYKKTEWKNDETHLNASNMNNIEYGVDLSVRNSSQNSRNIEDHNKKIEILNGTEETEGSVKKAVKDAKKEVIGDYSESYTGTKQQTIASTVEYFQGEVDSLNNEIDEADKKIDEKAKELQQNIDTLSTNSSINFNAHVENKNNPHEVTASQLNVYTKDQTFTKDQVKNEIALSGGGSGSVNIDTTLILEYTNPNYEVLIENISDITPQNIYINITSKNDIQPSGTLYILDNYSSQLEMETISDAGIFKFELNYPGIGDGINILYAPSDGSDNTLVTVSYLTEGGVEKLFDYIDITALTKLDTLISSGTASPNETITSQYYFKYSE